MLSRLIKQDQGQRKAVSRGPLRAFDIIKRQNSKWLAIISKTRCTAATSKQQAAAQNAEQEANKTATAAARAAVTSAAPVTRPPTTCA